MKTSRKTPSSTNRSKNSSPKILFAVLIFLNHFTVCFIFPLLKIRDALNEIQDRAGEHDERPAACGKRATLHAPLVPESHGNPRDGDPDHKNTGSDRPYQEIPDPTQKGIQIRFSVRFRERHGCLKHQKRYRDQDPENLLPKFVVHRSPPVIVRGAL
jgi:hypothetical protein